MKHGEFVKYGIVTVVGIALAAGFLVSDRWMADPRVYIEEAGDIGYKFNIGFQWTTLLGMLGIIMFVVGVSHLLHLKKYVIEMTSAVVVLINMSAWDFFNSTSANYYLLVLECEGNIIMWGNILKYISAVLMIGLIVFMIAAKNKLNTSIPFHIIAILIFIAATGSLMIKTVCNPWFLGQVLLAVVVTVLISESARRSEMGRK